MEAPTPLSPTYGLWVSAGIYTDAMISEANIPARLFMR